MQAISDTLDELRQRPAQFSADDSAVRATFDAFVLAIKYAGHQRGFVFDDYFMDGTYVDTMLTAGGLVYMIESAESGEVSPSAVAPELRQFLAEHATDVCWMLTTYKPLTQWVKLWQ